MSSQKSSRRNRELALIHIAKKDLMGSGALDEDAYRWAIAGILERRNLDQKGEIPSAADLDPRGRGELIEAFKISFGWTGGGEVVKKERAHIGRYYGSGTRGQGPFLTQDTADEIARLEDVLGWTADPKRLQGFIERQTGHKKSVRMLTKSQASKVIVGLKRVAGISPHPRSRKRSNA